MFENDDPIQRESLIKTLLGVGVNACELNSGGGTMHVIVTLFDFTVDPPINAAESLALRSELQNGAKDRPYGGYLYVATNSSETDCEIGLMGIDGRTAAQVSLEEWQAVSSLEEAVETMQKYWNERDKWLRAYLAGELITW